MLLLLIIMLDWTGLDRSTEASRHCRGGQDRRPRLAFERSIADTATKQALGI